MRRTTTTLLAVAAIGFAANFLGAQNATTYEDQNRGGPRTEADDPTPESNKALIDKLAEKNRIQQGQIDALEAANQQQLEDIEGLKVEVRRLGKALGDLSTKSGGKYVPKIFANMDVSDDFRTEVMRANQGRLILNNKMPYSVTYFINGARWRIPKGQHSISVPLGKVTVHSRGEMPETIRPREWKLDASGQVYQVRRSIQPLNSVPRGN